MVLAPHVQRGSFMFGLRLFGFRHAGKYDWADTAGWTGAVGWATMQKARQAKIRAIGACIGIRAFMVLTMSLNRRGFSWC